MMRENQFRKLGPIALLVWALLFLSGGAMAESYVWPLDDSKNISSGFCSYRDAHYHGGLDISTNGEEGLAVRAADSGFVFRITTSYWGYGKAVYLKLADGRIAVYGHLSDFSESIRHYVEKQQYSLKRYNTNLFPLADELPVGRGEVIGRTGQSGYGPPHLHYEIRTADNFPINPLSLDIGYTDQTAPHFEGVIVRPLLTLDPGARVGGGLSPVFVKAESAGRSNRYIVKQRIIVEGAVGLAVECHDPTNYKGYATATGRMTVMVNGLRFFERTYDSLDFALTRQLDLDYDFDWLAATGGRANTLYRHPANTLPWYNPDLPDGVLDLKRPGSPLKPGENSIEIIAADPAGNEASLELTILINRAPQAEQVGLEISGWQWFIAGQLIESDDPVTRFELQRHDEDQGKWETIWEKADSVTADRFSYLIPGEFTPLDQLRLVLVDSWNAESVYPVRILGISSQPRSDLDPSAREAAQVICDFVPGGLAVKARRGKAKVGDDRIALLARLNSPLPEDWDIFLDAREFHRATRDGLWEQVVLSEDRLGVIGAVHPGDQNPDDETLLWPGELYVVDPDYSTTVYSTDSVARARFNAGDVYDGGFYRIRHFVPPRKLEAKPASTVYSYEPISVPFARKVEVGISYADLPAAVDDLALYALRNDREDWLFLGRDVDADEKFMSARVWSFGPYALVADTEPPKISKVIPGKGSKTKNRRPEITFKLEDNLSGIGSDQDIEIILDGDWLIPEYDPETERGKTRPSRKLAPGKHKLEITARDRVGHEDYFLRYFTVVK